MKAREGPDRKAPEPARPRQEPRVVILTGVSGSGKSTALRALEDAGFYCVDNLPIVFLEKLLELSAHTAGEVTRIALVVDAREGRFLAEAPRVIDDVRRTGTRVEVVFLEATDEALLRRYSETRRRHPLAGGSGTVSEGIAAERKALEGLKTIANEIIDSSSLNVHELKRLVHVRFVEAVNSSHAEGLVMVTVAVTVPSAHVTVAPTGRLCPTSATKVCSAVSAGSWT